jgi:hypothetical protein
VLKKAMEPNKTVHSPGNSGAADLHDLNGPEIRKWLRRGTLDRAIEAAKAAGIELSDAQLARLRAAESWLQHLHSSLLKKGTWDSTEIESFSILVADIWARWTAVTGDTPFPKLHLLIHCKEFAQSLHYLGDFAESPIERFHANFNRLLYVTNRNKANDKKEQYRRSLAHSTLAALFFFAPA